MRNYFRFRYWLVRLAFNGTIVEDPIEIAAEDDDACESLALEYCAHQSDPNDIFTISSAEKSWKYVRLNKTQWLKFLRWNVFAGGGAFIQGWSTDQGFPVVDGTGMLWIRDKSPRRKGRHG